MSVRKTIRVSDLTAKINKMIAATPDNFTAERLALATLLESVLMDTGNYHGYRHTDGARGTLDDTRRSYYGV